MALAVIFFSMLEIRCLIHTWQIPMHNLEPAIQTRISMSYRPKHQYEMLLIHGLEADGRGI